MTNKLDDVIGVPMPSNMIVRGIGGALNGVMDYTIRWKLKDDNGEVHTILLLNSLYVPELPGRMLSLQHWAQCVNEGDGT